MEKSNLIIADSSALVSLIIKSDQNHARARAILQQITATNRVVIIPCDVFAETLNILGKKFGHYPAVEAVNILLDGALFVVDDLGSAVRREAIVNFEELTRSVSFTDCIVMAFADARNTSYVFGFDEAFYKNGYYLPDKQAA